MTHSLFVLFHRPGPRWQPGVPFPEQPGIMDHIGFMQSLDQDGRLVLGRPIRRSAGWTGGRWSGRDGDHRG